MFVSGFTFINNAIRFDYPIVEAIQSILPLCDEVVVAVGNGGDGTRVLVEGLDSPKVRIVDTVWDDSLREGGRVLAAETDKAYAAIDPRADWAVYIQGDEVMHEDGHKVVRQAMRDHLTNLEVDGLLFNYRHFYGSYDFVGASDRWYAHEVGWSGLVQPSGPFATRRGFGFATTNCFAWSPWRRTCIITVGSNLPRSCRTNGWRSTNSGTATNG